MSHDDDDRRDDDGPPAAEPAPPAGGAAVPVLPVLKKDPIDFLLRTERAQVDEYTTFHGFGPAGTKT